MLALLLAALFPVVVPLLLGLSLDRLLGEPRRFHPLVGFGRYAAAVERLMRRIGSYRGAGLLAWIVAVLPWVALAGSLKEAHVWLGVVVDVGLLYFAVGGRSLAEHARAVAVPLAQGDLASARQRLSWIVSRDTAELDESGVAKATVESVLENGNDAVFGALFWFALLGGPGALMFRLANTLDAMWGYRTERYLHFGWAAARIDDVLNFVPARLTALSYALLGHTANALRCWRTQAPTWDSPNAGPVMAAGAGALDVSLGGPAIYHGQLESRPPLGAGAPAQAADIDKALALVSNSVWLWVLAVAAVSALIHA
ncbi:MAG: adenosylcobinamide-phosphate synthase CbiB [Zoogloea sp.]|uniref:adenosylcobinamide-phosphate synthase CbiB n=1 Tax=Zoogloea sp. TaxID=49181 RepID=UPI0026345180|nr:adenosylcobinamide-phosphate synthase CbiB [Zoogloea sp.]MDD2988864.1 adenosylcobinamide-phosphate synthase CbiB [Zoogloea sp.]